MASKTFNESVVEQAAIEWLEELGWQYMYGPLLDPNSADPERPDWRTVILRRRLLEALTRINPHLPADAIEEVARQVQRLSSPSLEKNNQAFHRMIRDGIPLSVKRGGTARGDLARLFDEHNPDRNDWLVVNQLTVTEDGNNRRPDLVLYVNGLPLIIIELKNPIDPDATIQGAWNQLQLYKRHIPMLFQTNAVLIVSDGTEAMLGSLTSGLDRFAPWRTIDGSSPAPAALPKLQVLLHGLLERRRFLDYIHNFILWEMEKELKKKIAGYHQFHAVNKALSSTIRASAATGDQRAGVVWHTQGSGKSISMVWYTAKVLRSLEMRNPTVVVVTDRNDLDDQLYGQFCRAKNLLPVPLQVERMTPAPVDPDEPDSPPDTPDRDLRSMLSRASGGCIFTTVQMFGMTGEERKSSAPFPCLSERRNIVVIVDEAHRTQYGFETRIDKKTGQITRGLARNLRDALPNASFIGFTGTPLELDDRSTPAVFGEYIDTYTIRQAVEDGATVPIFYEARLVKIDLPGDKKQDIDAAFEEVTEGAEEDTRQKLKTTWAKLEALVGAPERIAQIAQDIVDHWARRTEILAGKAMIVCMSRRICVELYDAIVKLCPGWHGSTDDTGNIKVVMTGAGSDPTTFHPHIRGYERQKAIEERFKDDKDPLQIVIVRDMWLTGFDVPCAHTLYMDKPMQKHGLLQAIARVNRRFRDKPSGLVVDYLGLADQLREAISIYKDAPQERPGVPVEVALTVLQEKVEVVRALFHGFDYRDWFSPKAPARLGALQGGVNHICGLERGDPEKSKKRYLEAMGLLNKAAGIALHLEGARKLRDEIGYFQAVQGNIQKYTMSGTGKTDSEMNLAIRQIVSSAISSEGVLDVFGAAGLQKPDISVLSDGFLETVKETRHVNLQLEVLRRLLEDEIARQGSRNVVQSRRFSEMLERTLKAYQNRSLESAQVILDLIEMAKEMREAPKRGEVLGLTEDELAFYDALADHGNVRAVMGDPILAAIARDLATTIRNSVSIDWTQKESARADIRRKVKRLLKKHGYPPDKQEGATTTIIEQAEKVCKEWSATI